MGRYDGLNWQVLEIPFSAGLRSNTDVRARPSPSLDIARDVQFDEVGGLQTRHPFLPMSNAIVGGGALANCRKLAVVNDELCVFTDTSLYSWNQQLGGWVLRGAHLAVAIDEEPRFVTEGDQIDGDRAELAGTAVYAWTDAGQLFAAAMDVSTGSVLVSPMQVGTATGRARLIALSTRILLFAADTGNALTVRSIDPAAPRNGLVATGTPIASGTFDAYYDVVRAGSLVAGAYRTTAATSYTAFTVTADLAVVTAGKARPCIGPLAVAATPDGTRIQIIRNSASRTIRGDQLLTATLTDVFSEQAIGTIGTTVESIAACYRSIPTNGSLRCYVFWCDTLNIQSHVSWVDVSGAIGPDSTFIPGLGLGSRAFEFGGSVYVWLTFAQGTSSVVAGSGPLVQNTMLLFRDDGLCVAKSLDGVTGAGGGDTVAVPSIGHLPGVAATAPGRYALLGAFRRVLQTGDKGTTYSARASIDITANFDSNEARRSAVLGRTLYIAAGEVSQYDGERIAEVGFSIFPASFSLAPTTGGNIAPGTYLYDLSYRAVNAKFERERSTSATLNQLTIQSPSTAALISSVSALTTTRKKAVTVEAWRSQANQAVGAPLYLVTSVDPNRTGSNSYLRNDPSARFLSGSVVDALADTDATKREGHPENGDALESVAPPGARIVLATDVRLWLAGVTGDPDRVWYSRERNDNELASFHESLFAEVPRGGGQITACWFQDGVLYVSRESSIYVIPGKGKNNLGQGIGFDDARLISSDVGAVSQEAQALTPIGTVLKTRKGWHLLDHGGSLRYVGGAVKAFDGDRVVAMTVMTGQHQVRILTDSRLLLWDYRGAVDAAAPDALGHWSEWTIVDGLDATLWRGQYVYLTPSGPKIEQSTFNVGVDYGLDVETSWIKLAGLQGAARVRRVQPLGENRGAEFVRLRAAYNYDPTYVDDVAWAPPPASIGSPLQFSHGLSRPQCEAVKIRITACREVQRASLSMTTLPIAILGGALWTTHIDALLPGELGNALVLEIAFVDGPRAVDVRDGLRFDLTIGAWMPARNVIGMRVTCRPGDELTTGDLTLALSLAGFDSKLYIVSMVDSRQEPIDIAAMLGQVVTGTFRGGAFAPPNNEALKLTALGLEVGIESGLFRLSKNQQV